MSSARASTGFLFKRGRSLRVPVNVCRNSDDVLRIDSSEFGIGQTIALCDISVSPRIASVPRMLWLQDGSTLEVVDNELIDDWIESSSDASKSRKSKTLYAAESKWVWAVVAFAVIVVFLNIFFRILLPPVAGQFASLVPHQVQTRISSEAMQYLDERLLKPSRLPSSRRETLNRKFESVLENIETKYQYELHFRHGSHPNAFALPGGQIVMTDELVELVNNDEEILAVLLHEVAHVEFQHTLRRMIKDAASLVVLMTLLGDVSAVSSLASTAPTFFVSMSFSRHAEIESDRYAVEFMKKHGMNSLALIRVMEKLYEDTGEDDLKNYFSTHPGREKRIENIRFSIEEPR